MKKLPLFKLPVLAAVLALTTAFAYNPMSPTVPKDETLMLMGYYNGAWIDITGLEYGVHYACLWSPEMCTAWFQDGVMIPSTLRPGTFFLIEE